MDVQALTPFVQDADFTLYVGDALEVLRELPDESVHCCVTSPPYWGLRDYGTAGQIGLEATPELFVESMVVVFREVRRVLRGDGTLWLNLGDSYANDTKWGGTTGGKHAEGLHAAGGLGRGKRDTGLKAKEMVGIPWRVAFALQADGWYLRSDIVWSKPNPMPESVTDRPTKAHEYVFLLSKSPRYFFDQEAVREKYQDGPGLNGGAYSPPGQSPHGNARGPDGRRKTSVLGQDGSLQHRDGERWPNGGRNIRSVWEIATQPYPQAHFATFPEALPERCIKAGCPEWVCGDCGRPATPVQSEDAPTTVQRVRGDVHEAGSERLLLKGVRESGDSAQQDVDTRLREGEGLQDASSPGSSNGKPRGVRDGAPAGHGGALGPDADGGRGRPSPERGPGRQPGSEPRANAEAEARSSEETSAEADPVSPLRRAGSSTASCSEACSGRLTPGVVLDPFSGSGTTALVARKLGRKSIGIELSEEYARLAADRLKQLSLFAETAS